MRIRLATALLTVLVSTSVGATNWLQLQGNEPPNAPAFRWGGFIQPTYTHIQASPVNGLQGAPAIFNGRYSTLNLNWPSLSTPHQFQVLRAGMAMRGKLNDEVNFFLAADAGRNGSTLYTDAVLSDASLTFNYIPGARIRAGLFKLPTSEEALLAVNVSGAYIYNSNAVLYMLVGLPVEATGTVNPSGASSARLASGFSGYRDWGVQVYDWMQRGQWEYSYAAMVSNGNAIDTPRDNDDRKDLTLRVQASYLLGKAGPNREDLSVFLWRQRGSRLFGSEHFGLIREGVGIKYLYDGIRLSSEYLQADGMVVGGQAPPFVGQPFAAGVNEAASGWYVEGGWRFRPEWEADIRYDYLDFMKRTATNEREFSTLTLGLQYFFSPAVHLIVNHEWRKMSVSNPSDIPAGPARDNAQLIADNLGDRMSVQLTWSF
jgi:hypothetical protein